jgi:hypothetical protein
MNCGKLAWMVRPALCVLARYLSMDSLRETLCDPSTESLLHKVNKCLITVTRCLGDKSG